MLSLKREKIAVVKFRPFEEECKARHCVYMGVLSVWSMHRKWAWLCVLVHSLSPLAFNFDRNCHHHRRLWEVKGRVGARCNSARVRNISQRSGWGRSVVRCFCMLNCLWQLRHINWGHYLLLRWNTWLVAGLGKMYIAGLSTRRAWKGVAKWYCLLVICGCRSSRDLEWNAAGIVIVIHCVQDVRVKP